MKEFPTQIETRDLMVTINDLLISGTLNIKKKREETGGGLERSNKSWMKKEKMVCFV